MGNETHRMSHFNIKIEELPSLEKKVSAKVLTHTRKRTDFLFTPNYGILFAEHERQLYTVTGLLRIRQAQIELELRFAGDGCVPTSQLN